VAAPKPHFNLLILEWLACSHTPLASAANVSPDEGITLLPIALVALNYPFVWQPKPTLAAPLVPIGSCFVYQYYIRNIPSSYFYPTYHIPWNTPLLV
jgi:hypothetical protein